MNPPKEYEGIAAARGQMQAWELTLDKLISGAARDYGQVRVITRGENGATRISNWAGIEALSRQVSSALRHHGIIAGDRVGTLLWNNDHHLALWFGAMGIGSVLHTLNPRLHASQLRFIINDAGNRVLVIEERFCELIEEIADEIPTVELIVVAASTEKVPTIGKIDTISLDTFLSRNDRSPIQWGDFDEQAASGLCYTSGTTGGPKGVLYSHRSHFLHAIFANQPNGIALSATDIVLPVVPMFHANAWGIPFAAAMAGATMVMPGSKLDGGSLVDIILQEHVTFAGAVPTIWQDVVRVARERGIEQFPNLRALVGGAAVSSDILQGLTALGVRVIHAWGMTELSPLGAMTMCMPDERDFDAAAMLERQLRQGKLLFPIEAKITDDSHIALPHDGVAVGALRVRGPAVVQRYFNADHDAVDSDGFFETGDISNIDRTGFIKLVDRSKDVIKSGGEWISSIELENAMMSHPMVTRAAAIAVPHEKWGERPLLVVEARDGEALSEASLIEHLHPLVPKWWLPERFVFMPVPLGSTGKIDKVALRKAIAATAPLPVEAS